MQHFKASTISRNTHRGKKLTHLKLVFNDIFEEEKIAWEIADVPDFYSKSTSLYLS